MIRTALAISLSLAIVPLTTTTASAHPGDAHKVMGTVTSIQNTQLVVKSKTGEMSTFAITDHTKIVRGSTAAVIADIKVGDRVVVTATMPRAEGEKGAPHGSGHGGVMTASEIRLGTAAAKIGKPG